jgi:hypothetical protein
MDIGDATVAETGETGWTIGYSRFAQQHRAGPGTGGVALIRFKLTGMIPADPSFGAQTANEAPQHRLNPEAIAKDGSDCSSP